MAKFKRILLKLSGESLMGSQSYGIDPERLSDYARQIKEVHEMGVQIGIVIGGGNIFRGLSGSQKGFDRVKGDQMGMCATVINSLALSSALGAIGVKNKVLTAIRMEQVESHRGNGGWLYLYLLCRYRQSIFHHRYWFFIAWHRDRGRRDAQGNPSRRHLYRRSGERPNCHEV